MKSKNLHLRLGQLKLFRVIDQILVWQVDLQIKLHRLQQHALYTHDFILKYAQIYGNLVRPGLHHQQQQTHNKGVPVFVTIDGRENVLSGSNYVFALLWGFRHFPGKEQTAHGDNLQISV